MRKATCTKCGAERFYLKNMDKLEMNTCLNCGAYVSYKTDPFDKFVKKTESMWFDYFHKSGSKEHRMDDLCNYLQYDIEENLLFDIIKTHLTRATPKERIENIRYFDIEYISHEIIKYNAEEVEKIADTFKRDDPIYIFNGVRAPREKVIEWVKAEFACIKITIQAKGVGYDAKSYCNEACDGGVK